MSLSAILAGMFGCTKKPEPETEPEPEFGAVGEDFSQPGPGEYKKLAGCDFSVSGYNPGFVYSIAKSSDDSGCTVLTYEDRDRGIGEITCKVSDKVMEELSQLCAELNILSWDKYSMRMQGVLDGSGFSLSISYEDGTAIRASGDNCFPTNYQEFEKRFREILEQTVKAETARLCEERYQAGDYSQKLEMVMINYSGRGASGSDSYSFMIRESSSAAVRADMTVKSASGVFLKPGSYHYYGNPEDTDTLLAGIQEVVEKYKVYKWDGYDASTPDYNDREWFQLSFSYPEASINCCGCGDTENYVEVRRELLEILTEYLKNYSEGE